jgi:protein-S-isoprenylcysteine O-methyltransferase Ste14
MTGDFKRPFAPPPAIFGVAFLIGLAVDFSLPLPMLPLVLQLVAGFSSLTIGVLLIRSSMKGIWGAGTTYNPYAASTVLVTSGIYTYSRNPGYLGLVVIQLGMALIIDSAWVALTAVVAMVVIDLFVIRLEEEKLSQAFGQEYTDYLKQVRRWI